MLTSSQYVDFVFKTKHSLETLSPKLIGAVFLVEHLMPNGSNASQQLIISYSYNSSIFNFNSPMNRTTFLSQCQRHVADLCPLNYQWFLMLDSEYRLISCELAFQIALSSLYEHEEI
jgi:hypothetical protein